MYTVVIHRRGECAYFLGLKTYEWELVHSVCVLCHPTAASRLLSGCLSISHWLALAAAEGEPPEPLVAVRQLNL